MKIALIGVGGVAVFLLLVRWAMSQIRYRVGSKYFVVSLLGIPIRKIAIEQIEYASKREPDGFAERWYNTLSTSHRLLTIEKKSGFPKYMCITPKNRYVILTEIKAAVRKIRPEANWAKAKTVEPLPEL